LIDARSIRTIVSREPEGVDAEEDTERRRTLIKGEK